MAESYPFNKARFVEHELLAEIRAAWPLDAPAVLDVQSSAAFPGQVLVVVAEALTAEQQAALAALVAAHGGRPRRPRQVAAVASALREWVAAGTTAGERQQRAALVACAGGAPGLVAYPRLAVLLGIGVDGDEESP